VKAHGEAQVEVKGNRPVLVKLPPNIAYPELLPTIKTLGMLPSSMVSRELGSKIKESVSTSLFPYNTSFTY